ncbi:MAG: arginine--tRNA ligase [Rhodobiaceae bacterium]|nr:arginine--tRNA ligase [Rhodobiaceae bacterium]
MDILEKYKKILIMELNKSYSKEDLSKISFEFPREASHGDFSTNAALILSKKLKINLDQIFEEVKKFFEESDDFKDIVLAKSGFINFFVKDHILHDFIREVLKDRKNFGKKEIGKGERVNIEYVSANPTGPLHVGHTRGAVFGDTLANIFNFVGFDVCREYYINDSGEQIRNLAKSVYLRYKQNFSDKEISIPEDLYPGDYLIPIAKKISEEHGKKFLDKDESIWLDFFKRESISSVMNIIKNDLKSLEIKHDVFISENVLLKEGHVNKAYKYLEDKKLLYEGSTNPPKGSKKDEWIEKKHILFKSKNFGDDEDRVVKKHDGQWTYFMPDIAYHLNKYERGFIRMINIFGADHSGYIARMKAAVKAVTNEKANLEIKTCQLVRLSRAGKPVKMSKRAGSFITLKEIVNEVGKDAVRFMMVSRKNDAQLDFDFEVFKNENNDNPIFYIQYANARISSLIRNSEEKIGIDIKDKDLLNADLALLQNENEKKIIFQIANFPKVIEQSATFMEPHRLSYYLRDLASSFHQYWNLKIDNKRIHILDKSEIDLSLARVALLFAVSITIKTGLGLLGIEAIEEL